MPAHRTRTFLNLLTFTHRLFISCRWKLPHDYRIKTHRAYLGEQIKNYLNASRTKFQNLQFQPSTLVTMAIISSDDQRAIPTEAFGGTYSPVFGQTNLDFASRDPSFPPLYRYGCGSNSLADTHEKMQIAKKDTIKIGNEQNSAIGVAS